MAVSTDASSSFGFGFLRDGPPKQKVYWTVSPLWNGCAKEDTSEDEASVGEGVMVGVPMREHKWATQKGYLGAPVRRADSINGYVSDAL